MNRQEARPIACKLDIILVNDAWMEDYPNASAMTGASLLSDHAPIIPTLNPDHAPITGLACQAMRRLSIKVGEPALMITLCFS